MKNHFTIFLLIFLFFAAAFSFNPSLAQTSETAPDCTDDPVDPGTCNDSDDDPPQSTTAQTTWTDDYPYME